MFNCTQKHCTRSRSCQMQNIPVLCSQIDVFHLALLLSGNSAVAWRWHLTAGLVSRRCQWLCLMRLMIIRRRRLISFRPNNGIEVRVAHLSWLKSWQPRVQQAAHSSCQHAAKVVCWNCLAELRTVRRACARHNQDAANSAQNLFMHVHTVITCSFCLTQHSILAAILHIVALWLTNNLKEQTLDW